MALNRRFSKENGWLSASERLALCVGFGGSISSQYSAAGAFLGQFAEAFTAQSPATLGCVVFFFAIGLIFFVGVRLFACGKFK